jgi:hypothetical protein
MVTIKMIKNNPKCMKTVIFLPKFKCVIKIKHFFKSIAASSDAVEKYKIAPREVIGVVLYP